MNEQIGVEYHTIEQGADKLELMSDGSGMLVDVVRHKDGVATSYYKQYDGLWYPYTIGMNV